MGSLTEGRDLHEVGAALDAHPEDGKPPRHHTIALAWPVTLFIVISLFVAADMAADIHDGVGGLHLGLEIFALSLCLAGVWGTGVQLRRALRRTHDLQRDLDGTRADLARWRGEAQGLLRGLGAAIETQFKRWDLSPAECDVALLILKGLSYKEVADARTTSESTVRHQALAIYRKAGLAGRAEMSAFFLEDLLLPRDGR
jgi:DNA-binding CsgD family transcriptional regulator